MIYFMDSKYLNNTGCEIIILLSRITTIFMQNYSSDEIMEWLKDRDIDSIASLD